MPISKKNTLYYTADQYALAQANSSALKYALSCGYDLVRHGSYYVMKEHDSMVFSQDGSWHWNSRSLHGNALDFIVNYEGKTFVEAVLTLAGEFYSPKSSILHNAKNVTAKPAISLFKLPQKADTERHMFAYLCQTRKLSNTIVKEMIQQKILYQAQHELSPGKYAYNACFVSYDNNGKPCSAFNRGLNPQKSYKMETPGGDKSHGWLLHGKDPQALFVFEAALDAASYVDLGLNAQENPLSGADYMALGGLNFTPIANYLKSHPKIKNVHLCLDNDDPGRNTAAVFSKRLQHLGICVDEQYPPQGKDWNELLQKYASLREFSVHKEVKQTDSLIRAPPKITEQSLSLPEQIKQARAKAEAQWARTSAQVKCMDRER